MSLIESALLVSTGFILGVGHSLDPDHLVAVSSIICKSPNLRKSIVSATVWGVGHSIMVVIVSLIVLAFRSYVPENIWTLLEIPAGIALIVLGALLLRSIISSQPNMFQQSHSHTHLDEEGRSYTHVHSHVHKSAFAGFLQGVSGSATVMLVMLASVPSIELGMVFILMYGIGLILAMIGFACLFSSLLGLTRLQKVHAKIQAVIGLVSVGFGVLIVIQALLVYL